MSKEVGLWSANKSEFITVDGLEHHEIQMKSKGEGDVADMAVIPNLALLLRSFVILSYMFWLIRHAEKAVQTTIRKSWQVGARFSLLSGSRCPSFVQSQFF